MMACLHMSGSDALSNESSKIIDSGTLRAKAALFKNNAGNSAGPALDLSSSLTSLR